jgi:HPt (histidine-containing phosphotransfer) domain-containing protein
MPYQEIETLDRRVIAAFRDGVPDGAPDIASMLIDQFLLEAASQAERLHEAGQRGDAAAVKAVAHNLKGSSMTMGAKRLGTLCTALEAHTRQSSAVDGSALISELMTELDCELVHVRAALLAERDCGCRS